MKTNMLNLENYGVQKMSAKEMKETEGGFDPFTIIAAIGTIVMVVGAVGDSLGWWNSARPGVGTPRPSSSGGSDYNQARIQ